MRKFLRIPATIFFIALILLLLNVNFSIYHKPKFLKTPQGYVNMDVMYQLQHLKHELHDKNAGKNMQNLYPEGFLFINALYGLAWYDATAHLSQDSPYRKKALKEISWAFDKTNSVHGKSTFFQGLPIEYGAFYMGWNNLLLGRKLALQNSTERLKEDIKLFETNCRQIATFIRKNETPFAESYSNMAWSADMTVCVASLSFHDRILKTAYKKDIQKWLTAVKKRLDTQTGLIPHKSDAESGMPETGARGSSMSLMLAFFPEIDSVFARQQFKIYEKLFLDTRLGLPGIREYPKGTAGWGDVDSGPVLWGIGGSASIVGLKVLYQQKKLKTAVDLRNSLEGFGVSLQNTEEKKFLFGVLPMADAFIVWSNAQQIFPDKQADNWQWQFHLYSFLLITLFSVIIYLIWNFRFKSPLQNEKA